MESEDRRNPYLILGLPYGSDRADATKAMARRSRIARREPEFPYSLEDLTWALNQIEAQIDDPTSSLDTYRVPADPSVLDLPPGPGILRPPPVRMERRTEPPSADEIAQLISEIHLDCVDQLKETIAENAAMELGVTPAARSIRFAPAEAPKRRRGFLGF